MASYSDNFAGTGSLSASWVKYTAAGFGVIERVSDQGKNVSVSSWGLYIYNSAASTDDSYVQMAFKATNSGARACQLGVRVNSSSSGSWPDGYALHLNLASGSPAWSVFMYSGGSYSGLVAGTTFTYSAGDVMRLEAAGTTIRIKQNGSLLHSFTNSTLSGSSNRKFYIAAIDDMPFDDFSAGDLSAPPVTQVFMPMSSFIVQ